MSDKPKDPSSGIGESQTPNAPIKPPTVTEADESDPPTGGGSGSGGGVRPSDPPIGSGSGGS
jgi:hypothetical protein